MSNQDHKNSYNSNYDSILSTSTFNHSSTSINTNTSTATSSIPFLNKNVSGKTLANSLLSQNANASTTIFSPSNLSVHTLASTNNLTTSTSIQKSLSTLDVKQMAKDISSAIDLNPSLEENSWPQLVIRVLPLFNGERLNGCIEDLNEAVRLCLKTVDLATLTKDIYKDLLAAGMFTINAKLAGVHDDKVITRLVELWSFFLGTVLPYLEGVFLPHQIEVNNSRRSSGLRCVRDMALGSFKEQVITPILDRLEYAVDQLILENEGGNRDDGASKLLQMMAILAMTPPIAEVKRQVMFDSIAAKLRQRWLQRVRKQ